MAVIFEIEFFCVVMPCSVVVGYKRFGAPCCLHFQGEDGGSMDLRNVGILLKHYTASQPRRPRLDVMNLSQIFGS